MALVAAPLGAAGCFQAEISEGTPVRPPGQRPAPPPSGNGPGGGGSPSPGQGTAPPGPGSGAGPGAGVSPGPVAGFEVPNTQIKLLPFSVRLGRIAAVTGVPTTDPAYASLLEDRLLLGDHDYANAKPPQDGWSAARLTLWVEGLRPICRTASVRNRYSPMPAKLAALVEAAHGRALLPEDTAALNDSLRGLSLTPDKVVETACLSVLSSLEFVAQ